MPVYNGENYICEALDSLIAQSFKDFELLISDNASTDGTQSICEAYARMDKRIRYVRQPSNLGVMKNLEYVLDHSSGQYFMWAAHDDMWATNWMDTLVSQFTEHDFSIRGAIRFMRGHEIIRERFPSNYSKGDYIRFFIEEETSVNARNFYMYGLFDRRKLSELGRDALSADDFPDFLFTFQMLQGGNLRTIRGTYQVYRMHSENTGSKRIRCKTFQERFARLLYSVHPTAHYLQYIAAAPANVKPLIALLAPIKHADNQVHLWWRGLRKLVSNVENV
jgi:glycosyltransferase involved in cell wall biosynthesis